MKSETIVLFRLELATQALHAHIGSFEKTFFLKQQNVSRIPLCHLNFFSSVSRICLRRIALQNRRYLSLSKRATKEAKDQVRVTSLHSFFGRLASLFGTAAAS